MNTINNQIFNNYIIYNQRIEPIIHYIQRIEIPEELINDIRRMQNRELTEETRRVLIDSDLIDPSTQEPYINTVELACHHFTSSFLLENNLLNNRCSICRRPIERIQNRRREDIDNRIRRIFEYDQPRLGFTYREFAESIERDYANSAENRQRGANEERQAQINNDRRMAENLS